MEEPDPRLVQRAGGGDVDAFEALVRAYQGPAWRFAQSYVRDRELASDATQEAFIRAYRFLGSFRGDSKFSSWLFRIVRNCCLDLMERRARPAPHLPPSPAPDHETRIEIERAVADLRPELREPFLLVELFGFPYADASAILSVKEGTVKSRVHRARVALAAALAEPEVSGEM